VKSDGDVCSAMNCGEFRGAEEQGSQSWQ